MVYSQNVCTVGLDLIRNKIIKIIKLNLKNNKLLKEYNFSDTGTLLNNMFWRK